MLAEIQTDKISTNQTDSSNDVDDISSKTKENRTYNSKDNMLKIHDIHLYGQPTNEQLSINRIQNLRDKMVSNVDYLFEACLVHGTRARNDNLKSAIKRSLIKKYDENISNMYTKFIVEVLSGSFLPTLLQVISPVVDYRGSKSVRCEGFLPVANTVQVDGTNKTYINIPKSISIITSTMSTVAWTGYVLLLRKSEIRKIQEEIAEFEANALVTDITILREAIITLMDLLIEVNEMLEQYKDLDNSQHEYDEKIDHVHEQLLKLRLTLRKQIFKYKAELSVLVSKILRNASTQDGLIISSVYDNVYISPKFQQSPFFDMLDTVYQNELEPLHPNHLTQVYAHEISDAKVYNLLVLNADKNAIGLVTTAIKSLTVIGDILHTRLRIHAGSPNSEDTLISMYALRLDPGMKINKPCLWFWCIFAATFAQEMLNIYKAYIVIKEKKSGIYDKFYSNLNDLTKSSSDGIGIISGIEDTCCNLEKAYKVLSDSNAKCLEGLNPILASEHVNAKTKVVESSISYFDLKLSVNKNYRKCHHLSKKIDILYQYYYDVIQGGDTGGR